MRLCCLSLSFQPEFTAKQLNDLSFIDLCAQLRLDGVDFNMSSLRTLARDHLKMVKKLCLERGLTIACIGINNDFGRPAAEQDAVHQQIRSGIDTAQFLGASVVRVFAGYVRQGRQPRGRFGSGPSRASNALRTMRKRPASWRRSRITTTTMYRTGEDVVRLLKEVDHPWCSHMLDTGQYLGSLGAGGAQSNDARTYDVYRSIERSARWLSTCGPNSIDCGAGKRSGSITAHISRISAPPKYNGFISLVYEGWSDTDAVHAIAAERQILAPLHRIGLNWPD